MSNSSFGQKSIRQHHGGVVGHRVRDVFSPRDCKRAFATSCRVKSSSTKQVLSAEQARDTNSSIISRRPTDVDASDCEAERKRQRLWSKTGDVVSVNIVDCVNGNDDRFKQKVSSTRQNSNLRKEMTLALSQEILTAPTQELPPAPTQDLYAEPTQQSLLAPTQELEPVPTQDASSATMQELPAAQTQDLLPTQTHELQVPIRDVQRRLCRNASVAPPIVKIQPATVSAIPAEKQGLDHTQVIKERDASAQVRRKSVGEGLQGETPRGVSADTRSHEGDSEEDRGGASRIRERNVQPAPSVPSVREFLEMTPPPPHIHRTKTAAITVPQPNDKMKSFKEFVKRGMELRGEFLSHDRSLRCQEVEVAKDDASADSSLVKRAPFATHQELACASPPLAPCCDVAVSPSEVATLVTPLLSRLPPAATLPPTSRPSNIDPETPMHSTLRASLGILRPLVGGCVSPSIPDESIKASSCLGNDPGRGFGQMWRSRLDCEETAWCAGSNDRNQWIQWDFGSPKLVSKVGTKGRYDVPQWVTRYGLGYSHDGEDWTRLSESFTGNTDQDTLVENEIVPAVAARMWRLHPLGWHRRVSLRAELWGYWIGGGDCLRESNLLAGSAAQDVKASLKVASEFPMVEVARTAATEDPAQTSEAPMRACITAGAAAQEARIALSRLLSLLAPASWTSAVADSSLLISAVAATAATAIAGSDGIHRRRSGETPDGVVEMLKLIESLSGSLDNRSADSTNEFVCQTLHGSGSIVSSARLRLTSLLSERVARTEARAQAEAERARRIVAVYQSLREALG